MARAETLLLAHSTAMTRSGVAATPAPAPTTAPFAGPTARRRTRRSGGYGTSAGSVAELRQGSLRLVTGTAGGYGDKLSVQQWTATRRDGGVRLAVTPVSGTESYFSVMLRGAGTGTAAGDADGYRLELNASGGAQVQRRGTRPAAVSPGLQIAGFQPGRVVNVAFSIVGSTLSLTVWDRFDAAVGGDLDRH